MQMSGLETGKGSDMDHTILGWLAIGIVAGVLGKLIMPGKDPGGFVVTILLGIAGALLAGFVGLSLNIEARGPFATYGGATLGAVALLIIYRVVMRVRIG
jgi:uncharacterized membrane protein YeaQ/YmgE (transglycosylase-associated protein family)